MKKEKGWDLEITPGRGALDLRLKQVLRYRDLLVLLVKRDFIAMYKQTVLGPVWYLLQPLFTMMVYLFLFGNLAGISTDGIPGPVFYLSGIIAWSYFAECLTKTSNVFRENASMFGKVYFPRIIMPLSIIVSSMVKFGIQLFLLLVMVLYFLLSGSQFTPTVYLALFPLLVILMAAQALGLGMLVSAMTTKYRDLAFLLNFGIPLLMYTTPVVYPLSTIGGNLKLFISANPITPIIEGMRLGFFGKGELTATSLSYAVVVSIMLLFAGAVVFNKVEKDFVDTV